MSRLRCPPLSTGLAALCLGLAGVALAPGCKAPPAANPEFDDAAQYLLRIFHSGSDAERAYGVRALEEQCYLNMDLEANDANKRVVSPAPIDEDDIADLEHPDQDPADNLTIALGFLSDFQVRDHADVFFLQDMRPVEPSSPDIYQRTILEGEDCFLSHDCDVLRTLNDIERKNILYQVRYDLYKDYRWIDLNLPDPALVPEGEEAVNEGEPRWAIQQRSWMKESAFGDGATIWQSYAIEVWVPRDCEGYIRAAGDENRDGGNWETDSCGGGSMRMQAMWSETELGTEVGDDVMLAATRGGIDDIFEATEDWLAEH